MINIDLKINKDDFKKKLGITEPIVDTAEDIVDKVNKSSVKIDKSMVDGLLDIERITKENSLPVTTSFINGKRAKNINFSGATVSYEGDTATVTTASGASWGSITGTLSNQTDLQTALDAKFTLPSLTNGSILFSNGTTIAQDNANFFWDDTNNRLGIGTNSPTARLHLPAGSATANTAPLKFTSGTNLTAAEVGAMEYDGTSLFFTRSGTLRAGLLMTDSDSTYNTYSQSAKGATAFTTGNNNILLGNTAGSALTTGYDNILLGRGTTGGTGFIYNIVMGPQANAGGNFNVILGGLAGLSNTSTSNSVAIGYQANRYSTAPDNGVAIGAEAESGSGENVAIGRGTATASGGTYNVSIGSYAGRYAATGVGNTLLGNRTGTALTSGTYNVAIGYQTGNAITSGSKNVAIGYDVDAQSNTADGQLTIQNAIFGTGNTGTGTTVSTGNLGIYTPAPTARLHFPAGTATANTAPLKLTSGTALAAIEDGAMEYHGSHLYFSIGGTRYQLDQQGGATTWGTITGTLSSQTDLQTALDGKVDENVAITGATKTKITYDAKGLVTAGADATTADISDSTDKRYVTDAQLTVIGNTSGTNTGDQTSIVGITGTLSEFNAALTGADFATGGGTVTGTSSGTNTGDQTSIVGITGTKAQFDTAVTDGNILYVGDITQYTDEMAQDATGAMVANSTFVNLDYVDGTPSLTASLSATGTPSASTYLRGDNTWASVSGGAFAIYETEIDFGATPLSEQSFTITVAGMTTANKVMCSVSYATPTGKDQDELEMDDLQLRAVAGTGNFTLYVRAADGSYLADKFKINYSYA